MQSRLSLGWLFLPGTGVWVKGGLQRDEEKKNTLYYIRKAGEWIRKWLHAKSTGYTTRRPDHWSAQPTQLSSHPRPAQGWSFFFFAGSQPVPVANKRNAAENTVTRLKWSSRRSYHNTYAQDSTEAGMQISHTSTSGIQPRDCFLWALLSCCRCTHRSPSVTLDSCSSPLPHIIIPTFLMQEGPCHRWAHTSTQETSREEWCFKAEGL